MFVFVQIYFIGLVQHVRHKKWAVQFKLALAHPNVVMISDCIVQQIVFVIRHFIGIPLQTLSYFPQVILTWSLNILFPGTWSCFQSHPDWPCLTVTKHWKWMLLDLLLGLSCLTLDSVELSSLCISSYRVLHLGHSYFGQWPHSSGILNSVCNSST